MSECLPDFPRYINQEDGCWYGADDRKGPWRPIPAPQSGLPWVTDGPAVPESREPASVAAEARPLRFAAQAIDQAAYASWVAQDAPRPIAAAVVRELAEQAGSAKHWHVDQLLAIAAELEGSNA